MVFNRLTQLATAKNLIAEKQDFISAPVNWVFCMTA